MPRDSSNPTPLDRDALDRLEKSHRQLVQSVRAIGQLADRVAHRVAESNGGSPPQRGGEILTRREKVDHLLKSGATTWLSTHKDASRIREYAFDQQTVALGNDATTHAASEKPQSPSTTKPEKSEKKHDGVTNLSSALGAINRDAAQAGIKAVLLFTDGRHNDPAAQDPRAVAKTLSEIPVYVVPVGSSHTPRDLILHHVDAPRAVVDGDQLVVEATVTACDCAGEKCTVELSEHNAVVDRQELSINSPRRDFRVRLTTIAKGGGAMTIH